MKRALIVSYEGRLPHESGADLDLWLEQGSARLVAVLKFKQVLKAYFLLRAPHLFAPPYRTRTAVAMADPGDTLPQDKRQPSSLPTPCVPGR